MDVIELNEELITIVALDVLRHDLNDFLTSSETKLPNQTFLEDCYIMTELALKKKLKKFPQYEELINRFRDTYPKGSPEAEGGNPNVHEP